MSQVVIPVVLVESHQHVLEHIHDVLRKKKIFRENWSMVHFDAHPDLACSKTAPAIACFNPRQYCSLSSKSGNVNGESHDGTGVQEEGMNLYEILDLTSSGIAEWILPLVLAANLNKIEWIKPEFSSQIGQGDYEFAVGVELETSNGNCEGDSNEEMMSYLDLPESARIKVDFQHPYYLDDSSVTSKEKLVLEQNLELKVSELQSLPQEKEKRRSCGEKSNSSERKTNLWTLDICLDYFACHNPYVADLEKRSSLVASAFLNVMESSVFSTNKNESSIKSNKLAVRLDYQTEILRFYKLLEEILRANLDENSQTSDSTSCSSSGATSFANIQKYFERPKHAKEIIEQLLMEINNDCGDRTGLTSMVMEAIPNWSMPHDTSSAVTDRIDESLRLVEAHIQAHLEENDRPFLVTIARSTLDGFCPPQVVEQLQSRVLEILGRQICGEDCHFCETDISSCNNGKGGFVAARP